jgi:hypothetical protein
MRPLARVAGALAVLPRLHLGQFTTNHATGRFAVAFLFRWMVNEPVAAAVRDDRAIAPRPIALACGHWPDPVEGSGFAWPRCCLPGSNRDDHELRRGVRKVREPHREFPANNQIPSTGFSELTATGVAGDQSSRGPADAQKRLCNGKSRT